jgi:hypothetical protein
MNSISKLEALIPIGFTQNALHEAKIELLSAARSAYGDVSDPYDYWPKETVRALRALDRADDERRRGTLTVAQALGCCKAVRYALKAIDSDVRDCGMNPRDYERHMNDMLRAGLLVQKGE